MQDGRFSWGISCVCLAYLVHYGHVGFWTGAFTFFGIGLLALWAAEFCRGK